MSGIFHKSCYTSRSSGYKYRTLSTNTGSRKRRDSQEENAFDRKFKELKKEIASRIDKEVEDSHNTRDSIEEKFMKVDAKINSMVDLQKTVLGLRNDLSSAEGTLVELLDKVKKIEVFTKSEAFSLQSQKSSFRTQAPIQEEVEVDNSNITHI